MPQIVAVPTAAAQQPLVFFLQTRLLARCSHGQPHTHTAASGLGSVPVFLHEENESCILHFPREHQGYQTIGSYL